MCGICGFLYRDRRPAADSLRDIAGRMADALAHRGPDDRGVWVDAEAGIALGHRRLAILDLSAEGAQPMSSACGRYEIAYNGEVYNFRELASELRGLGHSFRGHSDTEVVVAAIAEWGVREALSRLNGMFALALWDRQQRNLTLARDRVGKKPLYYGWCGDAFLFGSELEALRVHPDFDPEIDRDALGLLLRHTWIPAPYSIFRGVGKLVAGSFLTLDVGRGNGAVREIVEPYWSARAVVERGAREPFCGSYEEATDVLDARLRDAVGQRMVADVPLGALLSGGIDSTTVVATMQALSPRPVKTFTIGFREPRYDEAAHARRIARHVGTDHTELYVTAEDGLALIPELPRIYDEPFADTSQIPTYLVSRLARRDVTVALSGDGGDELFVGYGSYFRALRQWRRFGGIPRPLRRAAGAVLGALARASWPRVAAAERAGVGGVARLIGRLDKLADRIEARDVRALFEALRVNCRRPAELVLGARPLATSLSDPDRWPGALQPLQLLPYLDLTGFMTDGILVKVDRASMAEGLEVRCPILDHHIVELAWSLPLEMRVDAAGGKRILREILARYVPRELTERPKHGFGVPVAAWLRGSLRDWAESLLDVRRLRNQGYLEPDGVRRIWEQHLAGWRDHNQLLWSILMFQAWLEHRTRGALADG
jgi:asparagine synthase (glutamine-hydrolysing)